MHGVKVEMVRDTGFEPVTPSVSGRCSTTELTAHCQKPSGVREARMDRRRHATPFFNEKEAEDPQISRP